MEQRVEIEVPLMNQIGMGSYSDRVYCDGLQVVVNCLIWNSYQLKKNLYFLKVYHFVPHQSTVVFLR